MFEAGGADAADAPSTSGKGSDGGGSSSGGGSNGGMPFHEVLARRLELLQGQGALGGLAQAPGGKPLPPFDRWAFAAEHYAQVGGRGAGDERWLSFARGPAAARAWSYAYALLCLPCP